MKKYILKVKKQTDGNFFHCYCLNASLPEKKIGDNENSFPSSLQPLIAVAIVYFPREISRLENQFEPGPTNKIQEQQ